MSILNQGQKLIITIVKKENAKKVVEASKKAGARGGTTILGHGISRNEKKYFFGIPVERERAIILTLIPQENYEKVLNAIIDSVDLEKAKHGIGMVINTKQIAGICHMFGLKIEEGIQYKEESINRMEESNLSYDLIVTIVNKGDSDKVVDASKKAGAEGGTIISGRGTGIHEKAKLFNILIEPEKEIVLTLITRDKTEAVLQAIEEEADLKTPGKGIAFVLDVERTVGINHELKRMIKEN
jgi:nitrogen regulatory protein PII